MVGIVFGEGIDDLRNRIIEAVLLVSQIAQRRFVGFGVNKKDMAILAARKKIFDTG